MHVWYINLIDYGALGSCKLFYTENNWFVPIFSVSSVLEFVHEFQLSHKWQRLSNMFWLNKMCNGRIIRSQVTNLDDVYCFHIYVFSLLYAIVQLHGYVYVWSQDKSSVHLWRTIGSCGLPFLCLLYTCTGLIARGKKMCHVFLHMILSFFFTIYMILSSQEN